MMASAFVKNTGILHLLLFGLLLPSVLVSVEVLDSVNTSTVAPTLTSSSITSVTSIQQTPTDMSPPSSATSSPGTRQSTISSDGATVTAIATTSTQPLTSTSGGSTQSTTQSLKSTSGNMTPNSTLLPTPSTSGGFSTTQFHTSTSKGSSNTMMTFPTMNSTANGTMSNSTSMNMTHLHCHSFSCFSSECYWMYMNQNATRCTAAYCQLLKTKDMWYSVGCSASCAERCTNATQTNCSVNCCNSTGCLRSNFESMNATLTTTAAATTSTTKATQSSSTTTLAPADNQNQCSTGTCTGDGCYSAFKTTLQACTSAQPHCQLQKQLVNAAASWTAGCTNCTGLTTCQGTTQPPCVQECCKASTTSCLKLDGSVNVFSSATRGPHLHTELLVSILSLLAMALLL
ncbi:uncharacterized protein DDB_G0271670 isoform X1 [Nothobranchius furzeri]|uniref:Uncharacterized protein n=2 Tax=Nothobranchius furzeri TaxID=105023 RepID=A0A1A8B5T2_NOTFU|nr:uncharacterized protein LOC107379366 [Nothobranchius furzeri]